MHPEGINEAICCNLMNCYKGSCRSDQPAIIPDAKGIVIAERTVDIKTILEARETSAS